MAAREMHGSGQFVWQGSLLDSHRPPSGWILTILAFVVLEMGWWVYSKVPWENLRKLQIAPPLIASHGWTVGYITRKSGNPFRTGMCMDMFKNCCIVPNKNPSTGLHQAFEMMARGCLFLWQFPPFIMMLASFTRSENGWNPLVFTANNI